MNDVNFVKYIKKAGKVERTKEFEYGDGFVVKLAYASKFIWNQIREASRKTKFDPSTRRDEEQFDEPKSRREYALRVIQGWTGLTVKVLDTLIPGSFEATKEGLAEEEQVKTDEEIDDIEVEYNQDTANAIMDNSIDFENWVVETAQKTKNYQNVAERKQKQYENLESSQKEV